MALAELNHEEIESKTTNPDQALEDLAIQIINLNEEIHDLWVNDSACLVPNESSPDQPLLKKVEKLEKKALKIPPKTYRGILALSAISKTPGMIVDALNDLTSMEKASGYASHYAKQFLKKEKLSAKEIQKEADYIASGQAKSDYLEAERKKEREAKETKFIYPINETSTNKNSGRIQEIARALFQLHEFFNTNTDLFPEDDNVIIGAINRLFEAALELEVKTKEDCFTLTSLLPLFDDIPKEENGIVDQAKLQILKFSQEQVDRKKTDRAEEIPASHVKSSIDEKLFTTAMEYLALENHMDARIQPTIEGQEHENLGNRLNRTLDDVEKIDHPLGLLGIVSLCAMSQCPEDSIDDLDSKYALTRIAARANLEARKYISKSILETVAAQ